MLPIYWIYRIDTIEYLNPFPSDWQPLGLRRVPLRCHPIAALGVLNSHHFDHSRSWPLSALHHRPGDRLGQGGCNCNGYWQCRWNVFNLSISRPGSWPNLAKLKTFLPRYSVGWWWLSDLPRLCRNCCK